MSAGAGAALLALLTSPNKPLKDAVAWALDLVLRTDDARAGAMTGAPPFRIPTKPAPSRIDCAHCLIALLRRRRASHSAPRCLSVYPSADLMDKVLDGEAARTQLVMQLIATLSKRPAWVAPLRDAGVLHMLSAQLHAADLRLALEAMGLLESLCEDANNAIIVWNVRTREEFSWIPTTYTAAQTLT